MGFESGFKGLIFVFSTQSTTRRYTNCATGSVIKISLNNISMQVICKVRGSKLGRGKITRNIQTGPGTYPASCTMGTKCLSRRQSGQSLVLTTHQTLELSMGRAKLLPSLRACLTWWGTTCTFTFTSVP